MTAVAPDSKGQGPPPAYPPPPQAAFPAPGGQAPPPYIHSQPGPQGYGHPSAPGYANTSANIVIVGSGVGPVNGGMCSYYAHPQTIVCQHCNATVTTATTFSVGTYAWIVALIIVLLGFWLGCCLIPFCIDGCKDVIHTCPNCRCKVGRYSRM